MYLFEAARSRTGEPAARRPGLHGRNVLGSAGSHRRIDMRRIEDYALLGDLQTAALVGRDGSIDWCCFPRFDSGACFAALLGGPEHGRWLIAPAVPVRRMTRRYRHDTLILESVFETDQG